MYYLGGELTISFEFDVCEDTIEGVLDELAKELSVLKDLNNIKAQIESILSSEGKISTEK
jgi:hypothetical protein